MFGFDGYGMGFGGFQIFQLLFFIAFFGIFLVFLISAGKGIAQWGKNNRSPRLTVNAAVVAKRENVNVFPINFRLYVIPKSLGFLR